MSKLNTRSTLTPTSPIRTSSVPNARTALGGPGYTPVDAKGELYDLGVNLFAGEDNFHESAAARNARFTSLVETVAIQDPQWIFGFLGWLRSEGNIRTASIMGAVHAVHARLNDPRSVLSDQHSASHVPSWNRKIVDVVCRRADEPGEFMAYWINTYGKPIPMAVKRGLSDACTRLYNEYTYMKWDKDGAAVRFGDVIELVHAKPRNLYNGLLSSEISVPTFSQPALYSLAISDRHGNTKEIPGTLPMINANKRLRQEFLTNPEVLFDTAFLKAAGITWEDALSMAGSKVNKARLWEALIFSKSIPIFAMIRNLRNMEQAGISREAMKFVCNYISNPEVIAKSGIMPFQIYAAYKNVQSVHWSSALEDAFTHSVSNVPVLRGKSLILVDASGSMFGTKLSAKSELDRVEAAAVFGAALAVRNEGNADVYTFSDHVKLVTVSRGASMLKTTENIMKIAGSQRGGTNTAGAVNATYNGHDRVIIITDEQSSGILKTYNHGTYGNIDSQVPADKFLYSFDLAGHKVSDIPSGAKKRHQLAGMTDKSFNVMSLLERGRSAGYPWENK